MKKIQLTYSTVTTVFANTCILFLLINIIAYFIPSPVSDTQAENLYYTPEQLLKSSPDLIRTIHDGKATEEIAAIYRERPNVTAHPMMEFMTMPCSGNFYHVGFENCRYNSLVNQHNIKAKINNSTWVFGGSTVFGDGVTDDETIPFFLNKMDPGNAYINFGGLSNHQKLEIEKLLLLLQKGYRPTKVIFLDGLNDLYKITESNFEAHETPNRSVNAYTHNFSIGTIGLNKNLFYALPIVKLYYQYLAQYLIKNGSINAQVLGNFTQVNSLYTQQPVLHYYANEILLHQPKNTSTSSKKLIQYFQSNLLLLEALSKAYQFEFVVFIQPIGPFLSSNPFIKDTVAFKNDIRLYKNVKPVYHSVSTAIKHQQLPHYYDLSYAHNLCTHPYVDLTHYSKPMNQKLAELILEKIKQPTK